MAYHALMPSQPTVFTLGHSPDPDDAFMFYAMAEHKIDLRGYRFEHRLEDIQTLNERALRGELHISAISIHAFAYVSDRYALLPCGASMGDGYGPMVVATQTEGLAAGASDEETRAWLRNRKIAIPGRMTSAFLALQLYLGDFDHIVVPFDQIFDAVKSGQASAGLIIHEGQLTYSRSGFTKIVDLGEWWKRETGLPLPLGGTSCAKTFRFRCNAICSRLCGRALITGSPIAKRRWRTRCRMRAIWMRVSPESSSACT
jgi:1,4-dihydroxy-6-naphthoate synthase